MKFGMAALFAQSRNVLLTVLGTLILAFGTAVFLLPPGLVAGGMSGLALVIDALIPLEAVTVDLILAVLTWGAFLGGLFFLGKDFALKTLLSSAVYPVAVSLFLRLVSADVLGGLFCLEGRGYDELPLILSATVGGALVGVGCALTFLSGGSTGGTDILAFLLCKHFKRLKSSAAVFLVDALIITLGILLTKDLVLSLLGIISAMIAAMMIDKIFLGGTAAFVAQIVSKECEAINRAIIEQMARSTTILSVVGGYTEQSKTMLTVSFSMRQYALLMGIVLQRDPHAFVTVCKAHEIRGEGWTR